jgi:hypothetical protein
MLVLSFCASGQDFRATLQGTISDPQQAGVARASLSLRNTDTGVERTAVSDDDGFYVFQFLPPGSYSLSVRAPGFRTAVRSSISLNLSQTLREDVSLVLGDVTETVQVQADIATVETETTALGTAIRQEIRDNLPLKGRSSLFMFTLTPGVVNNRYGEDTRPNDTITNVLFSANGAPVAATDVFVDGVANTINVNRGVNISQWVPAVDSIGEFKLEVGTLSAEYGRSGGSMTNMAIRSGTNQIHGSLYEFFRNSKLDANQYFARGLNRPLAPYGANTYGVAVGGPVFLPKLYDGRNRTFWFMNYEGAKEGNAIDRTNSTPTAKMRAGDFSEVPQVIYDPFSVTSVNGVPMRTPFPGNIIPLSRQDPVGQKIITYYPNPTGGGTTAPWVNNFQFSGKWPRDYNMYAVKMDHQVNDRYSTFVRVNYGTALLIFPFDFDGIATGERNVVNRPHFGVSWGNTFLLSPRRTFDVRFGYARAKEDNKPWSDGFDLGLLGFPQSFINGVQNRAFPNIRVTGMMNLAGSPLINDPGYTWTLQPSLSELRGKHLLKYGADFRLLYGNFFRNLNGSGIFNFTTQWVNGPRADTPAANTGFALAALLLGTPASASIDLNTGVSILNKYQGFFVQDDWRIASKLTLNLGLRYEYETPRTERYDRTTRGFDRNATYNLGGIPSRGGLVYANSNGLPRGIYERDVNNFAPRVGLAWSLTPTTVIRGGYALNYVPIVGSVDAVGYSVTSPMVVSTNGIDVINRLSSPFPTGQLTPAGNSLGSQTLIGQSISFVDPSDATPLYHSWNINIQRQLFSGSVLQVGYIGGHGTRLTSEVAIGNNITENINQVDPKYLSLGSGLNQVVDNPYFGIITTGPISGRTVAYQQLLRPYPQFGNITRNLPAFGNSSYNALQMKFETRAWKGLTTILAYTWARNIGDISPYQDNYNRRIERAPMAFDTPQRLTTTMSWDVPVGRNRALGGQMNRALDAAIGGWNIAMFNTFQSGFPLSFGVNANTLFLSGAGAQRPNIIGDPLQGISGSHADRLNRYFNTAAFAQPANFTFGNAAARVSWVRGPGMNNWNLTVTKTFSVTERLKVNLRASSFNLMNHAVFSPPSTTFGTAQFGVISSQANISRQEEVVLKIVF